ncbi:MAG: SPOR domain-containing protein [Legionella sp.]|nr:SPOR domain-containing protein [Legionella sp.]
MKLVMDEKLKHRLIGLAVIISLGAIFAPAVMKKSSQTHENNFSVNVKLPPKPLAPDVVMNDERELFKTIKVAKVEIPAVSAENQLPELAKAAPIKSDMVSSKPSTVAHQAQPTVMDAPVKLALNQAARDTAKNTVHVAAAHAISKTPIIAKHNTPQPKLAVKEPKKPSSKSEIYAVQLASFSKLNNAQTLVNKLRGKGYKANLTKVAGKQGPVYKVFVGHSPRKDIALKLKSQLASSMQINGFVVNTGVS